MDQGIAAVLSSCITTVGATSAVLMGWFLFSGKVKDLKSAIDNSDKLLEAHQSSMEQKFFQINEKVEQVDNLFKSKLAGLGKIESAVDDLQKVGAVSVAGAAQSDILDALKQDWLTIRDMIEDIAASTPDGRVRAKYARIDRRQYQELIDALDQDGRIGSLGDSFRKALDLWHRYRNGRSIPSNEDSVLMDKLEKKIVAASEFLK